MTLRYLSICSGIEAATVAWHPLGWQPAGFAEIDKFPSAVLEHHYPSVPNFGDFTKIKAADVGSIDVLVGGTPCQSFSVAGLRGGLSDDRGNLALEFLRLAQRTKPRWLVWENVPGVTSSLSHDSPDPCPPPPPMDMECDGQEMETQDNYAAEELHAFQCFLAGLSNIGYGFAYRILDAQYFGLAQRRKRVFVVAYLGDWRRAAAVLFERESLRGDPAPSREARQAVAGTLSASAGKRGGAPNDHDVAGSVIAYGGNHTAGPIDVAAAVNAKGGSGRSDFESETFIAHTLRGEGFDASEDGCGRGTPLIPVQVLAATLDANYGKLQGCSGQDANHGHSHLVPVAYRVTGNDGAYALGDQAGCLNTGTDRSAQVVAFHENQRGEISINETVGALNSGGGKPGQGYPAVAVSLRGREGGGMAELGGEVMPALSTGGGGGNKAHTLTGAAVRRLTPRECERLQGFPDDYTLISYRRKPAADGPRYKAIGNSMAMPVMRWIGQNIDHVEREHGHRSQS